MNTAQVFKKSVTVNNSPIQDYVQPDGHTPLNYEMTPGFKPFTVCNLIMKCVGVIVSKRTSILGIIKLLLFLVFVGYHLFIYFYI